METNEYIYLFTSTPCSEAREWLQSQSSLEDAWKNCHRGDWMWWALRNGRGTLPEKSLSVKYAKWCADRARTHSSSSYAAAAAAAAAADAAYAAYAADDAADDAASADDAAAYASYAASAAASSAAYAASAAAAAASSAAYAASAAAAAASSAAYAAYADERKLQANWIRKHVLYPFGNK